MRLTFFYVFLWSKNNKSKEKTNKNLKIAKMRGTRKESLHSLHQRVRRLCYPGLHDSYTLATNSELIVILTIIT